MATQVQFRRGTTSQNNAFTGAQGELTIDVDLWTLRIHDGTTAGGRQVPTLTATQTFTNKTLGTGSVWNGSAIGLGYGGTGAALSGVAGAIVYSTGSAMSLSLAGTSGQVLTSGGTSGPTWVNASALSTGTATTATTATNIAGGSAGYLVYQLDTNTTDFIAPGNQGYILRSTGASTAPEWVTSALTIGSTAVQVGDTVTSFNGLDILTATGTSHWKIPVGTNNQRPGSPSVGMIRYNSDSSSFEGYASGAWSSLGGVKSVDGYTYICAETSAAASNGDLDFFAEASNGTSSTQVGQWNRTNLKDYTGTVVGTQTTQNVFNATATTVNAFGAATALNIGAASGTLTVGNATITGTNATALNLNGASPVIATTSTTASVFNSNVTTLNIGGAATTTSIGASTGTTTVKADLTVDGDVQVKGGDLTTNQTTFNLLNTTATTINIGGAATTLGIGASTGTLTVNNAQTVFNSTKSIQLPVGTTSQRPTAVTGQIRYNSELSTFEGYAASAWGSLGGVKSVDAFTYIIPETSAGASNGDLDFYAENSAGTAAQQVGQWNRNNLKDYTGTIVGTQTTQNVFNTTATTVNAFGAATTVGIGASTGTTTVNNNLTITGNLTVSGTTTTVDSTTINIQNAFVFEGATADAYETTLTTVDPTADRSISLPDASGTIVLKDTTDIFTNKTFDTAGTGNVFKVNGTQISDKTGSGKVVLETSPSLTTPTLGIATATSINKMAITAPATGSTLAVADGKTFTVNKTIILDGTDSTTITLPSTTGTVALNNQSFYIGTTSVAINRSSASLELTGISSITLPGSTSGTAQLIPSAVAGTSTVLTLPGQSGNIALSGYPNSSTSFPSGDLMSGETYAGESISLDPFGVALLPTYSLMDPVGSFVTLDLN
jgi:hypothetical protein